MEVSGKADQGAVISSKDSILICLPCDTDGLKEAAYGFCKDCQDHLCETCFKHHRRARPFKNHVLLDKHSMPKILVNVTTTFDDTEDFCKKHQEKQLEFHCKDHQCVACYVCIAQEHKHCKVDYIPDVSGNITDEMNNILQEIESLVSKCKINIENSRKTVQNLDQSHAKVVGEITVFRKIINECLDRMENQMMKEANTIVDDLKGKQQTVETVSSEITEELEHSHSLLSTLKEEKKLNRLFIEMKNVGKRLLVLSDKEKEVLDEHRTDDCIEFHQNTNLIDLLKIVNNYGKLLTRKQHSQIRSLDLQYTNTINVKCKTDKECEITGMVLIAPSKLIVADMNNNSVKMIDVDKGSIVTGIITSARPVDIIAFPENKLACTLIIEKSIQIMSYTDAELSLDQCIYVGECCNGIAYCQNKFVITCKESGKLIMINLQGDVLKVLKNPTAFQSPDRVVISKDEKFLYVSISYFNQSSKIVKIDWNGKLQKVFEQPVHIYPYGLQELEDESIIVNYRNSNSVLRLSNNLHRCEITGLEKANICKPTAVAYCDRKQKLYLSCCSRRKGIWTANIVKVFNVKWT